MALRRATAAVESELRLARRPLLLVLFAVPMLAALAGFGLQQHGSPAWPGPPSVAPERGRILAADGTVLAEGDVATRRYPQGSLAANVVGFSGAVQPDGRYGLEGVEYGLDARLQAGMDATLTLDPILQGAAERQLEAAVAESGAENGSVVALEVGTGRILAAASYPTFDPNHQSTYGRAAIRNQAFLHEYEPGSVMKPFVIGALLQSGRLQPDEMVPAPPAKRVGNQTFQDVASHPDELVVRDVLRYSSNTAMLSLTERFEPRELSGWLSHYGFGQEVPVRSAFTRSGHLNDWHDWVPQDQASVTIGQSMATTPLQLAAAYAVFANDGVYVPPVLVDDEATAEPYRVLSSEVARTVREMLHHTVEESGLAASRIPGVSVAGKTGTADIWSNEQGTYPAGWYSLTFAGMFPADDPEVVMVVMLQKPDPGATSTYVAAPLFRAIGSEVVAHWGVVPGPDRLLGARGELP
ncbi:MAG: penicillin-binding protein 2 [Trueperaceae bacterium]|nr:penicillin-binding protein 2 [Trueperaceae bacterium]